MIQRCAGIIAAILALNVCVIQADGAEAAPPGIKPEEIAAFNHALQLYNSGKYDQAAVELAKLCKDAPAFENAHEVYAEALERLGKNDAALAEFLKAESLAPNKPILLINLGTMYRLVGKPELARQSLEKFLRLYPNDPNVKVAKEYLNNVLTEQSRNEGVASSAGQDNYLEETVHGGASRWKHMPIAVCIVSGSGAKGYRENFSEILKDAFKDWSVASEGKLSFEFVANPDKASILCRWSDNPADLSDSGEGGEAIPSRSTDGEIDRVKILLLTSRSSEPSFSDEFIRHTSLHEVGHALGLVGHSSQPGDVMFSMSQTSRSEGLSPRDKRTLQLLYNAPDSFLREHPIVIESAGLLGSDSPKNRAIKLNAEGLVATGEQNYNKAIAKFEDGLKLAPDLEFLSLNLAIVYNKLAHTELNAHQEATAQKHLDLAVKYSVDAKRKDVAAQYCRTLIQVAQVLGNEGDVHKYEQLKRDLEATN